MPPETPPPAAITPPSASPNALPPSEAPPVAPNLDDELNDALSKAFPSQSNEPQPKKEAPKVEKPTEKAKEPEKPKEDPKPAPKEPKAELQKPEEITEDPPKTQDGWIAQKKRYKQAVQAIEQKDNEIKKLKAGFAEKGSATAKEVEDLRNEIKELSKYRTMVDIQADPEFISKYDQPIEKAKNTVKEMLGGMDVSKQVLDQIDFTNTKLMDEIIDHVGEHRDKITAKRLQRKIEEIVDLMDKRGETLSQQKTNYEKFMEDKKKESSLKGAENEGRALRHLENIAAAKDKAGNTLFPFLSKVTAPENATKPQIQQIEAHNKVVELMQQKLNGALKSETPEERAEVAVAAVASHYLQAQLRAVVKENASLKEELKKISNVTTEKENPSPNLGAPKQDGSLMNTDEALATHFGRR